MQFVNANIFLFFVATLVAGQHNATTTTSVETTTAVPVAKLLNPGSAKSENKQRPDASDKEKATRPPSLVMNSSISSSTPPNLIHNSVVTPAKVPSAPILPNLPPSSLSPNGTSSTMTANNGLMMMGNTSSMVDKKEEQNGASSFVSVTLIIPLLALLTLVRIFS